MCQSSPHHHGCAGSPQWQGTCCVSGVPAAPAPIKPQRMLRQAGVLLCRSGCWPAFLQGKPNGWPGRHHRATYCSLRLHTEGVRGDNSGEGLQGPPHAHNGPNTGAGRESPCEAGTGEWLTARGRLRRGGEVREPEDWGKRAWSGA